MYIPGFVYIIALYLVIFSRITLVATSYLRLGQVQNGQRYIRYRSSSQKNKAEPEECKSLQTTSLCYSNVKSTLSVPLTFNRVEKNKHENFYFCSSSSFFFLVTNNSKLYSVCDYYNIPNDVLLMEIIPTCFELRVS